MSNASKINNYRVISSKPENGQVLKFDSSKSSWLSTTESGFLKNNADDTTTGTLTIDKDITSATGFDSWTALKIDLDKTGATTTHNTIYGVRIDCDNTTATNGIVNMYGISNTPTLTFAADAGAAVVAGITQIVTGGAPSSSFGYGLIQTVTGSDLNIGIVQTVDDGGVDMELKSSANNADKCRISTTTNGATTIETIDADAELANFTLDIDGDIELNADGGDVVFKDDSASLASINSTGLTINNISAIGSDTDKFLMSDSGVVKYVTGANLRSYIGAGTSSFGGALNDLSDVSYSSGDLTITSLDKIVAGGSLEFDIEGDIELNANGGEITLKDDTATFGEFSTAAGKTSFKLYEAGGSSTDDYLQIVTATHGATVIKTHDNAAGAANLGFNIDGHIDMNDSPVGFNQFEPTYDGTNTDVDYRTNSNKAFATFGAGSITNIRLYFPAISGNFILLLKQDGTGSRTVTNWNAYDSAGNAAGGSSTVKFAGGSNPTLTTDANHVDIFSFYWDADNEIAYGAATLDFQF